MRMMTRKQERLLHELVTFAGGPLVVQEALAQLNDELGRPPTLEQLVRRISQLRTEHNPTLAAAR